MPQTEVIEVTMCGDCPFKKHDFYNGKHICKINKQNLKLYEYLRPTNCPLLTAPILVKVKTENNG